jgi:hypothetical protein
MRRRPSSRAIACCSWARHRSYVGWSSPAGPSADTARHGLPSRQMTTVHLAGLGEYEAVDSGPLLLRQRRRRPLLGAGGSSLQRMRTRAEVTSGVEGDASKCFQNAGRGGGGGFGMLCRSLVRCRGVRGALALGRGSCLAQPFACVQINGMGCAVRFFSSKITTARLRVEQQQTKPAATERRSLV